ncbi:MAG TPA: type II CAAX endopeptidase family protein [Anaerolineales bacterium]|nr:type II CAAX endopeptidase family protein [Anaerolineales bacterium]HLO34059.1 type II CAAX endopeptidase family protein [Anaerolineales bacterium]
MTTTGPLIPPDTRHGQVAWFLLFLLLLLRIPFTIAIIYYLPIDDQSGATVYEVGTYFLTALLIWWERDRLVNFHIDSSALCLMILFRPVQTLILSYWKVDSPLAFPSPTGLMLWAISLGLIIALWRSGFQPAHISSQTLGWLAIGLLSGACVSIAENLIIFQSMLSTAHSQQTPLTPVLLSTSLNLLYHLGFAPINEEPLFRGFLWGYLRQLKWTEIWIWLFQAVLFTSAHIYLAQQFPLAFWIFIPGAALLFGLLTWPSRSIAPAILAHAMINGSMYVLASILIGLIL